MYFLKTKGTAKIPDYIQVRDNNFILFDHFRADKLSISLSRFGIINNDSLLARIECLPYGVLYKIDLE